MLGHYFKIALRALLNRKFSTTMSVLCLSAGMAGSLLIGLYIFDELQFDQYHTRKDSIFRVTSRYDHGGSEYRSAQTEGNIAYVLTDRFPGVERATRLSPKDEVFLFLDKNAFKEGIVYTDSYFTEVFTVDFLLGDKSSCLDNPASIIIGATTARKLFGANWNQKSIIGETLFLDGHIPLTITGVFEDFSTHSHISSQLFASVPSEHEEWLNDKSKVYTYILLGKLASVELLERKLLSNRGLFGDLNTYLHLQPITRIHLFSDFGDENANVGSIKNIYSLAFVSFLLLVMTLANFVNLYTAGSFGRMKEMGVRKVIGAVNGQLRTQFLLETAIITFLSAIIACSFILIFLPDFSRITSKKFSPESLLDLNIALLLGVFLLVIPLLASAFSSIYISAMGATEALRGNSKGRVSVFGWRKGLVVLQFSISAVMITLCAVSYSQIDFVRHKNVGFDKKNIVTLANPYMLGSIEKIVGFKNKLLTIPGVSDASITGYTPSQSRWGIPKLTFSARDESLGPAVPANWLTVDEGFIRTMGIELITGRNFASIQENDARSIIINETAARQFIDNLREKDPMALELAIKDPKDSVYAGYKVIGIVKDFNFGSLHEAIKPVIMKVGLHRFEIALRLSPSVDKQEVLSQVMAIWQQNLPKVPFEYHSLEDRYDQLHQSDSAASKIFSVFCILTIIISAFGLFSIVTYSIMGRTKEVGIRKVLGASELGIALLLSREFGITLLMSYILALPVAAMISNKWINDFAYKIEISVWFYGITALILFFITCLTLGFQSIKAALANPIDNLRHD